jgi:hypothetical protein
MVEGKVYKHKRNTDVAILVLYVRERESCVEVDIAWINVVNPKRHLSMGMGETILIKKEDLNNWKLLE